MITRAGQITARIIKLYLEILVTPIQASLNDRFQGSLHRARLVHTTSRVTRLSLEIPTVPMKALLIMFKGPAHCLTPTRYNTHPLPFQCHRYRLQFDQTARNRMREKVTASIIFKERKASYSKR